MRKPDQIKADKQKQSTQEANQKPLRVLLCDKMWSKLRTQSHLIKENKK